MQCPECKSRSVVIKDGQKRCEAKGCPFIQFHVITYENENRQFEGEKGTENRFNSISSNSQNRQKESPRYEKNFYRGSTVIKDLIHTMKLSNDLQERAESKLIQVLKVKYSQQKTTHSKLQVSDDNLGAYCLWLACCDKRMQFKDVRIANQMGISKSAWSDIHAKMQTRFKSIMSIPPVTPEQFIRRICKKRKINQVQQNAMLEMAEKIRNAELIGGNKRSTVAACVFWQIMIRSSTYNRDGGFDIKQYLKNDQKSKYWTQRQFDISFEAVRKYKNEQIGNNIENYIPQFATRISINEDRGRNYEERGRNF